jgi:hypothetical protein
MGSFWDRPEYWRPIRVCLLHRPAMSGPRADPPGSRRPARTAPWRPGAARSGRKDRRAPELSPQDERLQRAVGEMEPVEIVGEPRFAGLHGEPAVAMGLDQVLPPSPRRRCFPSMIATDSACSSSRRRTTLPRAESNSCSASLLGSAEVVGIVGPPAERVRTSAASPRRQRPAYAVRWQQLANLRRAELAANYLGRPRQDPVARR